MMKNGVFGLFMAAVFMFCLAFIGCDSPTSPGSDDTHAVTGVTLDHKERTVPQNGTVTLTATVSPPDATNQTVEWTSSNTTVATVASGTVTGVAPGTATITVTTRDGGFEDTCTVTVTPPVVSITVTPETITAYYGEEPDWAELLTVTATYNNDTTGEVPITTELLSGFDPENTTDPQTVTVTYGEQTDTFTVTVKPVTSLAITTQPAKTDYYIDEELDLADMVVTASYDGPHTRTVTPEEYDISGFSSTTGGTKTITVSYGGKSAAFTVKVWYEITKVTVTPPTTQVKKSDITSGSKTIDFSAVVHAERGTPPQTVVWSIDDVTGSTTGGSSISETGILTIAQNETLEKLTIKAKLNYHDKETEGSAAVTISDIYDITDENEWDAAFTAISGSNGDNDGTEGNPKVWILNIKYDITVAGKTAANINGSYKEVGLMGTGTITLSGTGSIIHIGANQAFVLNGPTLHGNENNNKPVVHIGQGGTFTMQGGTISGNTNTVPSSGGGGGTEINFH
jgi:hypothetical protein